MTVFNGSITRRKRVVSGQVDKEMVVHEGNRYTDYTKWSCSVKRTMLVVQVARWRITRGLVDRENGLQWTGRTAESC